MNICLGDTVIPKNKKILYYNKPCIICFDGEFVRLFLKEDGKLNGKWHFIEEVIEGCNLIKE